MITINRRLMQITALMLVLLTLLFCFYQPYAKAVIVIDDVLIGATIAILILCGIAFLPEAGWSDVSTGVGGFLDQFPAVAEEIHSRISDGFVRATAATIALVKTAAQQYFTFDETGAGSLPIAGGASFTVTDWAQLPLTGGNYLFGSSNFGDFNLQLANGAQGTVTITINDLYTELSGVVEHNSSSSYHILSFVFTGGSTSVALTKTTFGGVQTSSTITLGSAFSQTNICINQSATSYSVGIYPRTAYGFVQTKYSGFDNYLAGGSCRLSASNPIGFTVSASGFDGIGNDVLPYNQTETYSDQAISDVIGGVGTLEEDGTKSIPVSIPAVGSIPQVAGDVLTGDIVSELDKAQAGAGAGEQEGSQTQTKEEDLEKGKLTPLIFTKFPFCLPWDLYAAFAVLRADPVAPVIDIPFQMDIAGAHIDTGFDLDLTWLDPVVVILRWFLLLAFVYALILVTQRLIRW